MTLYVFSVVSKQWSDYGNPFRPVSIILYYWEEVVKTNFRCIRDQREARQPPAFASFPPIQKIWWGFLLSTERPLPQPPRKSTSTMSSTLVRRKPGWYITDSFAISPPTHSHLLAQSSFEMGYPSLSVKKEATKRYPLSPLPHHNHSQWEIP